MHEAQILKGLTRSKKTVRSHTSFVNYNKRKSHLQYQVKNKELNIWGSVGLCLCRFKKNQRMSCGGNVVSFCLD